MFLGSSKISENENDMEQENGQGNVPDAQKNTECSDIANEILIEKTNQNQVAGIASGDLQSTENES